MSDPRDIDEDAILKGLSAEELDQLEYELQEMDPEVRRGGGGRSIRLSLPGGRLLTNFSETLAVRSNSSNRPSSCFILPAVHTSSLSCSVHAQCTSHYATFMRHI